MSDEYTELERLAKFCSSPGMDWTNSDVDQYHAACSPELILKLIQKSRVQTQLVEALEDANRWLRFQLDTHIEHREPKGYRSGTVTGTDGWAVVAIPDWDVRQRLDVLEAALAAAKETPTRLEDRIRREEEQEEIANNGQFGVGA